MSKRTVINKKKNKKRLLRGFILGVGVDLEKMFEIWFPWLIENKESKDE